jgi:hypothetical protein
MDPEVHGRAPFEGPVLTVAPPNRPLQLTNARVCGSGRFAAAFYWIRSQQNASR